MPHGFHFISLIASPFCRRRGWQLLLAAGIVLASRAAALPVFPGAIGYGTDTRAGRSGAVYRVTNLDDKGPGSLRFGIENVEGPRVIIFDVSGVIRLTSDLVVRNDGHGNYGFLTIAGQTAPGPGITLANAGLNITSHDVLVQHISIRTGDQLSPVDNRDCIKVGALPGHPVHHVVVDHVSCSWAVDETASIWTDRSTVSDVTFSNSIFSKPLINGGHSKGSHPYGVLGGRNSSKFSLIGNIMAFNLGRNPLIRDETAGAQVVNNLIYHPGVWGNGVVYIGDLTIPPHAVSVVGNLILRRPLPFVLEQTGPDGVRRPVQYQASDYRNTAIFVHDVVSPEAKLFLHDNRVLNPQDGVWHPINGDPYDSEIFKDSKTHPVARLKADPYANSGGVKWTPWPSTEVEPRLLARAGKTASRRDAIDAQLIDEIKSRGGSYLQDLSDLGEDPWAPVDVQNRRALPLPANPNADDDGDGYTNLEEWLHSLAAEAEGRKV
jgi:hypothetical protein